MSKKISVRNFVIDYNGGLTDVELSSKYGIPERTIQRKLAELRVQGLIVTRKELKELRPVEKTTKLPETYIDINGHTNIEELKKKLHLEWDILKPTKVPQKKKYFKTYLVTADYHIPYHNKVSIKAILKLMDDVSFDGFILLGDYMDMSPISHWDRNKKKTLEGRRLKEDYIIGNTLLDELDKRLPKNCDKRFFYGNHERFYYDLLEEIPGLEGVLDPQEELHLKERDYKIYNEINHIERIGRLSFTHGMYTVQNYVKKHIGEFKTNVIFGHLHSPRQRFDTSPAKEIAIAGYCLGCLCDMNPSYLVNKPHKWSHGFAVVYFYDNGYFDVDLKRIVKGKFIFNNKLYDDNK